MLAAGHIERAQSPYGAGILFVPKKGTTALRLCVDYRRLNQQTVADKHPTPRTDVTIEKMAGSQYFSKLDLTSGFYQIRIKEEDVPKTAFQTEWWSFQWKVMAFGLSNAPSTFQRAMDMVFDDMRHCTSIYMDDIILYSNTWDNHKRVSQQC